VTNLCLVTAVKRIGSTTAAVLGALEPLTAVVLGSLLFSEVITLNIVIGIILIIPSVIIVILTRGR
jgi:drug/metabolite transporter (DMT)-like permease